METYISYESDDNKRDTIKYKYIMEQLSKINYVDEEHGILTVEDIIKKCSKVFDRYDVQFCSNCSTDNK